MKPLQIGTVQELKRMISGRNTKSKEAVLIFKHLLVTEHKPSLTLIRSTWKGPMPLSSSRLPVSQDISNSVGLWVKGRGATTCWITRIDGM
jgi:hypothetical protein